VLEDISQRIAVSWIENQIIKAEHKDAYIYGLQLLLSTVINVVCIAIISIVTHRPLIWIAFLLGFIPLRITAGGYHAKSPLRCGIIFCGGYIIFLYLFLHILDSETVFIGMANSLISVALVFIFAPIPASNKPLSNIEFFQKRKLSRAITIMFLFVSVFCSFSLVSAKLMLAWSFGLLWASISLVMGKASTSLYQLRKE
jgi:accessory gene regulator B